MAKMKRIKIDPSKCTGCRHCEAACSIHHVTCKVNPRKARIRVVKDKNQYIPVIAGPFTDASCNAKNFIVMNGEVHDLCIICRASCPIKPLFKDPEGDLPLKCDFCGEPPSPSCVKWCNSGALELVDVDF